MTPLKTVLLAAATAMILTSGWQYHVQQERRDEAARLRSENDQLRLQATQRHEGQLAQSQAPKGAIGLPAASPGRSVQPELTEKTLASSGPATPGAADEYRNEGMVTPLATLQTLAWACDHADAALMEKLLIYDEDARQKTLQHFAAQSAGNPSLLPSIEAAAAALYIEDGMHHPYPSAKMLELARFEQLRPGRVLLHLPGANGDGYEFQQTPEGWKLAVTMKIVDAYLQETARRQAGK
jgi:hypothetical protein